MSEIGKRGFAALGGFTRGGRRVALVKLAGWGKIRLKHPLPPISEAEFEEMFLAITEGRT